MSRVLAKIQAAADTGENINWRQLREEIYDEHERATTSEEREHSLAVFTALMDLVDRTDIARENLNQFRETRHKDYNLLIVRESLVGENVCTETLNAVTRREVAAGRMHSDHELRIAAINGMAAPHHTRAELEAIAAGKSEPLHGWRRLLYKLTGK